MDTKWIASADGRSTLYTLFSRPEGEIRAALHLIHGFAEHIGRYGDLIQFFREHGILVFGNDHIGHGKSAAKPEELSDFGSFEALEPLLQDEISLAQDVKNTLPEGIPLFLLGHSMGSLMARALLYRAPSLYGKAVIMGTGDLPPVMTAVFAGILNVYKVLGKGHRKSPLLNQLAIGRNNQKFKPARTSCDWLSRDRENVDRYMADPLSGNPGSVHTFYVMNQLMKEIRRPENLKRMRSDLPVLFTAGAEDAFGEFGNGPRRVAELFRQAGMRSVDEKYYPAARHEILNESCAAEVRADLLRFYLAQMGDVRV